MICRACKTEIGEPVLDLGLSPVANNYPPVDDPAREPRYPLRLFVCPACFLAQIEDELRQRDETDSKRAASPLRVPDGATMVRSDGWTLARTVDEVVQIVLDAERELADGS